MPIVKWAKRFRTNSTAAGAARLNTIRRRGDVSCVHRLCLPARTVRRTRVARHGYAADAPFIDTPRDARNHYSKRFGIESSYRLAKQSLAFTSSSGCWTAAGDVCSEPIASRTAGGIFTDSNAAALPAAGRRLWRWSFTEFCEMVLRAAWTALGVRRSVPANQIHSTTGSSGSCPPLGTAIVSGDIVASAAVRRRQRPLTAETHRPCHFEN